MNKRTLTDSELYAHSKNRHEQKHLSHKLEHLQLCEHYSRDTIRVEINTLRQFMRDNLRNSGWSPVSLPPQFADDKLSSSRSDYNRRKSTDDDVRTADQLQKPWAYAYSANSHNKIYKDLSQAAENSKKALESSPTIGSFPASVSPRYGVTSSTSSSSTGGVPRLASRVSMTNAVDRAKTACRHNEKLLKARPRTSPNKAFGSPDVDLLQRVNHSLGESVSCKHVPNSTTNVRAKSAWTETSSKKKSVVESKRPKTVDGTHDAEARLGHTVAFSKGLKKQKNVYVCSTCGGTVGILDNLKLRDSAVLFKEFGRSKSALSSLDKNSSVNTPRTHSGDNGRTLCSCRRSNARKPPTSARISQQYDHEQDDELLKEKSNQRIDLQYKTQFGRKTSDTITAHDSDDSRQRVSVVNNKHCGSPITTTPEVTQTTPNNEYVEDKPNQAESLNRSTHQNFCKTNLRDVLIENENLLSSKSSTTLHHILITKQIRGNDANLNNDTKSESNDIVMLSPSEEEMESTTVVTCGEGHTEMKMNDFSVVPSTSVPHLAYSFDYNNHQDKPSESPENSLSSTNVNDDSPIMYTNNDSLLTRIKQQEVRQSVKRKSESKANNNTFMVNDSDDVIGIQFGSSSQTGQPIVTIHADTDFSHGKVEGMNHPQHVEITRLKSASKGTFNLSGIHQNIEERISPNAVVFRGNTLPLIDTKNLQNDMEKEIGPKRDSLECKTDTETLNSNILTDQGTEMGLKVTQNRTSMDETPISLSVNSSRKSSMSRRRSSIIRPSDYFGGLRHSRTNRRSSAQPARKSQTTGDDVFTRIAKALLERSKQTQQVPVAIRREDIRRELNKLKRFRPEGCNDNSIKSKSLNTTSFLEKQGSNTETHNLSNSKNIMSKDIDGVRHENISSKEKNIETISNNISKPIDDGNNNNNNMLKQNNHNVNKNLNDDSNDTKQVVETSADETQDAENQEQQPLDTSQSPSPSDDTSRPFLKNCTYHKGIRIANYVSPHLRYKTAAKDRAKRSISVRWHSDGGVFVTTHQLDVEPLTSKVSFPRHARQRALTKMVEANHTKPVDDSQHYLEAALRSRIQEFLQSVEPFCQN